ncbi:hypothetical protein [uncultured Dysosmobacter sp.]|uniref:hypothetical protein n=1 Tax=uncultured Dysosmobacter sp. TaxID=2591384 RepID=UPI00261EC100|nr:hypothetical protein [uncultured Dysosmobacter sp.]
MVKLKPCPFCGGKAEIREYSQGHSGNGDYTARYKCGCDKCKIFFDKESLFRLVDGQPKFEKNGFEDATNAWNNRPEIENSDAEQEGRE